MLDTSVTKQLILQMSTLKLMGKTDKLTFGIINFIVDNVDKRYKVYSALPGWEAPGGGTIPPNRCVTNLKPDIVIVDNEKKNLHIFEFTVPLTMNIEKINLEKPNNYAPIVTDITGFNCSVN